MTTLYLDRKNSQLNRQGKRLILRTEGNRPRSIPFLQLDQVVILGRVETDTASLGALADAGIAIHLLTGRFHRRMASVLGPLHKDSNRRLAQYATYQNKRLATDIARCFVRHKTVHQRRLLRMAQTRRADLRHPMKHTLETLNGIAEQLGQGGHTLEQLRGLEGAAANAYFGAYRRLFANSLNFVGRRRRPPPDPVNAALSLGYTLLHCDAVRAVHAAGLDPYLGFLHEPAYGRESLASDLIEPLRPRLDEVVWKLFSPRVLTADHFHRVDGGWLLGKKGRQIYFSIYEAHARIWRRWLRRSVYNLVHHLRELQS